MKFEPPKEMIRQRRDKPSPNREKVVRFLLHPLFKGKSQQTVLSLQTQALWYQTISEPNRPPIVGSDYPIKSDSAGSQRT